MRLPRRSLAGGSQLVVLAVLAFSPLCTGCQQGSPQPVVASDDSPSGQLSELFKKYQQASSYEDAGELFFVAQAEDGEEQKLPAIPFSVAFERPNKIRVQCLQAVIVADGQRLRASVDPLEDQVLSVPCPEKLNLQNVFPDKNLEEIARGQIEVTMPQLAMLLSDDPLKTLDLDGQPTKLDDCEIDGDKCHRVSVQGPQGAGVFWIDAASGLLRKFDFPSDGLKKKLQAAKCSLWVDFKGARVDSTVPADAFKFAVPSGVKVVKRFLPPPPTPPSSLLGKTPEDFTFVDLKGGTVGRDSLRGKVAVLDLWATWCSWCFKGFPNLEKVYEQYRDNDKIVILAVDTDELAVSDEKVRQSFEDAKLTIPIVRDQQQLVEKVFVGPGERLGLPTMVILGSDGTIQEFHIGYDENLAETLPKKLDQLLAGENLAQHELEAYEERQKKYNQELSEALVEEAPSESTGTPESTSASE